MVTGEEDFCLVHQKAQEEYRVDLEDRKMTATKLARNEGHEKSRWGDSADADNDEEDLAGKEEPGGEGVWKSRPAR